MEPERYLTMHKCDLCGNSAVVHDTTMDKKTGLRQEVHLCEECARKAGIPLPETEPLTQLLTHFAISKPMEKPARSRGAATCPECGLTLNEFRKSGVLGCPQCYDAFDRRLSPLIERAQNGRTHHVGKTPRRAGGSIDRQRLLQRLAKELDSAVAAEQYERAAELRDRLQSLEQQSPLASDS